MDRAAGCLCSKVILQLPVPYESVSPYIKPHCINTQQHLCPLPCLPASSSSGQCGGQPCMVRPFIPSINGRATVR
jgi:hypothetical protein